LQQPPYKVIVDDKKDDKNLPTPPSEEKVKTPFDDAPEIPINHLAMFIPDGTAKKGGVLTIYIYANLNRPVTSWAFRFVWLSKIFTLKSYTLSPMFEKEKMEEEFFVYDYNYRGIDIWGEYKGKSFIYLKYPLSNRTDIKGEKLYLCSIDLQMTPEIDVGVYANVFSGTTKWMTGFEPVGSSESILSVEEMLYNGVEKKEISLKVV
jgi:hypothetical protein